MKSTPIHTTLQKWGNSYAVRLPKIFLEQLNMRLNQKLDITINNNEIIVKKTQQHMTFEERMQGYSGEYKLPKEDN